MVMHIYLNRILFGMLLTLSAFALAPQATAQSDVETGLDVFPGGLDIASFGVTQDKPATFSAQYVRIDSSTGQLSITANLARGYHVYSVTQATGGPTPTTIRIDEKSRVKLIGSFEPDSPPLTSVNEAWPGLTIEEHNEKVVWTAKVELPADFAQPVDVAVKSLVCMTDGSCIPFEETLVAAFKETAIAKTAPAPEPSDAPVASTAPEMETAPAISLEPAADSPPAPFRDQEYVVQWSGQIEPAIVAPGQRATLLFTAKPDSKYHVYPAAVDDAESSTNFTIAKKSGLRIGEPVPSTEPLVDSSLGVAGSIEYHESEVTWSLPIVVPSDATTGNKEIEGSIVYQACTTTSCLPPKALQFKAQLVVGERSEGLPVTGYVTFVTAPFAATLDAAATTRWVDVIKDEAESPPKINSLLQQAPMASAPLGNEPATSATRGDDQAGDKTDQAADKSDKAGDKTDIAKQAKADQPPGVTEPSGFPLPAILAMAICGGLILNLMPCVLPVVGLKVMAFAEQAGENRGRVLLLNLWYTLGILVVFWALAVLATLPSLSFSWGQQFTYFEFRYGVTLLVFAMALSFLGVWEIPIPGFVGGNSTQKLQRKEGFSGAFFKGIFTTMLATPCSGPLLGTVFAFTIDKPAIITFSVFTAVGFGMALPYLLIAIYPGLLAYFPKPGAWMDTLKQFLAFLLLGTVVYLFAGFSDQDRVPVFASLIAVWFGCWVIGQVPGWSSLNRRLCAWAAGVSSATVICILAFRLLAPGPPVLNWEPYDEARLQELQGEGRTVLIDFTAKWCINCIVNYNVAINTVETSKLVEELDAVPMLADWTDQNDEIKNKLLELNSNSIPVLAIYPGRNPKSPIVLRDLLSQGDVLKALRKAGSSVDPSVEQSSVEQSSVEQSSVEQLSQLLPGND